MATDTDQSIRSDHHTLGVRSTQASPGDHSHDGGTSLSLSGRYVDLSTNQTANGNKAWGGAATFSSTVTANGAVQVNSTLGVTGTSTLSGWVNLGTGIAAGDHPIYLRSASGADPTHYIQYTADTVDGPRIAGYNGGKFYVSSAGANAGYWDSSGLHANGSMSVHGGGAQVTYDDRTGGTTWISYGTGNIARLYNSGDKMYVDTGGNVSAAGGLYESGYNNVRVFSNNNFPPCVRGSGTFRAGTVGLTSNASGIATVTHGLGGVPTSVVCQYETSSGSARDVHVSNKTSTTFDVTLYNTSTGAAVTGTAFQISWVAWG